MARIALSPADVQERYNTLKNALLAYQKVSARASWNAEAIMSGRIQLAKFAVRGNTLCLYLALDPKKLDTAQYNITDESASKKNDTVPCCLRLNSDRSIAQGLELIEKLAAEQQLEVNTKYNTTNFIPAAKTEEELLSLGLIKEA